MLDLTLDHWSVENISIQRQRTPNGLMYCMRVFYILYATVNFRPLSRREHIDNYSY